MDLETLAQEAGYHKFKGAGAWFRQNYEHGNSYDLFYNKGDNPETFYALRVSKKELGAFKAECIGSFINNYNGLLSGLGIAFAGTSVLGAIGVGAYARSAKSDFELSFLTALFAPLVAGAVCVVSLDYFLKRKDRGQEKLRSKVKERGNIKYGKEAVALFTKKANLYRLLKV